MAGTDQSMLMQTVTGCAVLGAGVGLILPRPTFRMSVAAAVSPWSQCHHCGTPFRPGLLGWVAAGNHCRHCGQTLGPPWWLCSSILAAASAALAWRLPMPRTADVAILAAWLVVLYAGALLAGIDIAVQRLPTPVLAATAVATVSIIGAGGALSQQPRLLCTALGAGVLLGVAYLLLALVAGTGMGMGDVRLAALLGLTLGTIGWTAVLLGGTLPYLLAAPAALARLARRRSRDSVHIPFGPFLVGGAILAATLVAS
jgi:leader peptidase (prepilin peptidase) / N-methyltransferase